MYRFLRVGVNNAYSRTKVCTYKEKSVGKCSVKECYEHNPEWSHKRHKQSCYRSVILKIARLLISLLTVNTLTSFHPMGNSIPDEFVSAICHDIQKLTFRCDTQQITSSLYERQFRNNNKECCCSIHSQYFWMESRLSEKRMYQHANTLSSMISVYYKHVLYLCSVPATIPVSNTYVTRAIATQEQTAIISL